MVEARESSLLAGNPVFVPKAAEDALDSRSGPQVLADPLDQLLIIKARAMHHDRRLMLRQQSINERAVCVCPLHRGTGAGEMIHGARGKVRFRPG
jgi:hypothetical protein